MKILVGSKNDYGPKKLKESFLIILQFFVIITCRFNFISRLVLLQMRVK